MIMTLCVCVCFAVGVLSWQRAASGAASRRARRLGLMMDVEQGEGKAPKSMHVSSAISLLNCIPSASTDRMLRIIEAAKAQVKEEDAGVKKTVGDGLTRGSLYAVLFDNDDGTGDDPSTVWYGFVRRYGVRVGTRFKEWMKPVDFDDDTVDEKLVLQFTWLAPADRKHWGRPPVPTYAFKSFGASGSQEGKKRGLCWGLFVQFAQVRVQVATTRCDDCACGCLSSQFPSPA